MNLLLVLLAFVAGTSACTTDGVPTAYSAGETIIVMAHANDTPPERRKWYDFRRGLFKKDCASGYSSACQRIREIDIEERDYFQQANGADLSH